MTEPVTQGQQAGRRWPAEATAYDDPATGVRVRHMTNARAHAQHFYFPVTGWYDDGRRLLFGSDRSGTPNYYSIDLATGAITQLTDLPPMPAPYHGRGTERSFRNRGAINPERPEAYFWLDQRGGDSTDHLAALDLETLELRSIYERPDGFLGANVGAAADGERVYTSIHEDTLSTHDIPVSDGTLRDVWRDRPESRVLSVPVDGGDPDVLHRRDDTWIKHVNASPTRPELLTFCHEGPWEEVDNRIWGLNRETGEHWEIRPREEAGERVGHEYWLRNGEDVGYHGNAGDGEPFLGVTRYDNADRIENRIDIGSHHFHSNTRDLFVGDGHVEYPYLLMWKRAGDKFIGPRTLAHHGATERPFDVHPRMSPDGEQVLFANDRSGYSDLYLVDVPPFDDLPEAEHE